MPRKKKEPEDPKKQMGDRALTILAHAHQNTILTRGDYELACMALKGVKGFRAKIKEFFKPMKKAADEAKGAILEQEKKLDGPAKEAEDLYKGQILAWDESDTAAREVEEARLNEEAKGRGLRAPITLRPPDKVEGISIRRQWRYRVIAEADVPDEFRKSVLDEEKIQAAVTAMKQNTDIPGIVAYCDRSVAAEAI